MSMSIEALQQKFFEYAEKQGVDFQVFPLEIEPHNFGGRHLEISVDGNFAIVGTDKGTETERRETKYLDQLFDWIIKFYS